MFLDCVPTGRLYAGDVVHDQGVPPRSSVRMREPHCRGRWVDMASGAVVETPYTPRDPRDGGG